MSKSSKNVADMLDYVQQLRRHTEGRRAIHVKLSALEKHFREEHYRRFVASALRPLITKFNATMFALPNADVVLMVKDASIDTIDPLLNNIRLKYKDSALISSIDVIQGVSDAFVEWFDLEEDYAAFVDYTQTLADGFLSSEPEEMPKKETTVKKRSPGMLELNARTPEPLAPSPKLKMVAMEKKGQEPEARKLDVELLGRISAALQSVDIAGMVRKQRVMAVLGSQGAQPVMVHRFVPLDVVFEALMKADIIAEDRWLSGYLENYVAGKLLSAKPAMANEQSIASCLRVSADSVCSDAFDQFDQSLGALHRSAIVIELSAIDLMYNFSSYQAAYKKLEAMGYKLSVADIDPRMLLWMDYSHLHADFVKLKRPTEQGSSWLTDKMAQQIKDKIQKIGFARIILDGCETKADIEAGQSLGITLFQGNAAEPVSSS